MSSAREPARTIELRNVRLVTGDRPAIPTTVEVVDGRIAAVRPSTEDRSAPPAVEVIDLDGRWLVPGLWDHHVHFSQWAIARDRLDVSSARSAAQAAAAVAESLAARPSRPDLIVAVGFRDALWPDEPTTARLDEHTGAIPVVLISGDLHAVWLNTAAQRRFGRPEEPSGLLREQDAFDIQLEVADLPEARIDELAAAAATAAAQRGVVGIVDFEWPDIAATWQRRMAAGSQALRVSCSVWPTYLDAAVARGLCTGDVLADTGGRATMGPLKVIIDGSLNTRTACCFDPYPGQDGPGSRGLLTVAPEELETLLRTARAAGIDAAVHAIGDRANSIALDAFARSGARGSIEHAQLVDAADIARMARLGLTASVQPEHAVDDRDVADRYWAGRTGQAYAYRSLHDAGVPLAFGSDAPVAPLDPWIAIAAAVHRTRDARPSWHPEQRVPVADALRASVRSAIEPGATADIAVLDRDPFAVTADELRTLPVAATLLGGDWTFNSLDQ